MTVKAIRQFPHTLINSVSRRTCVGVDRARDSRLVAVRDGESALLGLAGRGLAGSVQVLLLASRALAAGVRDPQVG